MKKVCALVTLMFIFLWASHIYAQIIDFEDLILSPDSYWNGSDGTGGFKSGGVFLNNNYNNDYGSWDGFAYSNKTDTTISGWDSQYNARPGHGVDGGSNYVIGYCSPFAATPPTLSFMLAQKVLGAYFTNNNYAFYSMFNGDAFAKRFGDDPNTPDDIEDDFPDWFKLTITGQDAEGAITGRVEVFLAQGRDIKDTWVWQDLSSLGEVKSLEFTLSSTDNSELWGMNTPAYFGMDNLQIISRDQNSEILPDQNSGILLDQNNEILLDQNRVSEILADKNNEDSEDKNNDGCFINTLLLTLE